MLCDPIVLKMATSAVDGTQLNVRLGGKMSPASGDPLDLDVVARGVIPNMTQLWSQQNVAMVNHCGDSVCLHCDGIDLIVNAKRTQVLSVEVFTNFGIDLGRKRLLVVKSNQHFYAAFAPIATKIIYTTTLGTLNRDYTQIPYQRINKHKYPWLDDPFAPHEV
jgi:microcystin degradation protein MlrC